MQNVESVYILVSVWFVVIKVSHCAPSPCHKYCKCTKHCGKAQYCSYTPITMWLDSHILMKLVVLKLRWIVCILPKYSCWWCHALFTSSLPLFFPSASLFVQEQLILVCLSYKLAYIFNTQCFYYSINTTGLLKSTVPPHLCVS